MVNFEDKSDAENDTRGLRTLQKLRAYNIMSAIFNLAAVLKEVKTKILANGWEQLLNGTEGEIDFK